MHSPIRIAPSLLAADFSRLDREIKSAEDAGADWLHVDVMDGHFVPNITVGPFIVEAIKRVASVPLDVHLMISDPAKFLDRFIDAGSDSINFHLETVSDARELIARIHSHGRKAGVAISPETPADSIRPVVEMVEQVMVMTVHPGFGGQQLLPECVEKVRQLARELPSHVDIAVDGGITDVTIAQAAAAGANVFVAGTAIFGLSDRNRAVATLRRLAEGAWSRKSVNTSKHTSN